MSRNGTPHLASCHGKSSSQRLNVGMTVPLPPLSVWAARIAKKTFLESICPKTQRTTARKGLNVGTGNYPQTARNDNCETWERYFSVAHDDINFVPQSRRFAAKRFPTSSDVCQQQAVWNFCAGDIFQPHARLHFKWKVYAFWCYAAC